MPTSASEMNKGDKLSSLTDLIRTRRSIFPPQFNEKPVDQSVLEEILENANWAPTHKLTEPWRFKVVRGEALGRLGDFMANRYLETTPRKLFLEKKFEKMKANPRRSAAVILICLRRDPEERIPEWEELASVAAAVQNMWLSCHAHGLGGYWSTPGIIEEMGDFIQLDPREKCLGLFYLGYYDNPPNQPSRNGIESKTEWIDS